MGLDAFLFPEEGVLLSRRCGSSFPLLHSSMNLNDSHFSSLLVNRKFRLDVPVFST